MLDLESGKERILVASHGIKHRPRWSKDGSQIAYLSSEKLSDYPEIRIADARDGIVLREYKPGKLIMKYEWAHVGEGFLFSYLEGDESKLGRLRSGDGAQPLQSDVGAWWAEAEDGLLAWVEGRAGPDVWTLPVGASAPVKLVNLAPPEEDARQLGRVETITYRTERKFTLEGKLLYPPDHVLAKNTR